MWNTLSNRVVRRAVSRHVGMCRGTMTCQVEINTWKAIGAVVTNCSKETKAGNQYFVVTLNSKSFWDT